MMVVKHIDSLTKIIEYISRVSLQPIIFNGKTFPVPEKFIISALFFRKFNCPDKCGGCCGRFTLDYFSPDEGPQEKIKRELTINGVSIPVWSYLQSPYEENKSHCDFMNEVGRCTIHEYNPIYGKPNPFSCQMEPIKLLLVKNRVYLTKRPFGRGWAMTKYNGEKGAICEFFNDKREEDFKWNLNILNQLYEITTLFKLETLLPEIINYVTDIQKKFLEKTITSLDNFVLWEKTSGYNRKEVIGMPSLFD